MTPFAEALQAAEQRLRTANVRRPASEARTIATFAAGGSLAATGGAVPPEFWALVERRAAREPSERITGVAMFRGLSLSIGPEVFVPRPETLPVVEASLSWLRAEGEAKPVVIDLCTGSGVIAMVVAAELPAARVHAVDIDPAACERARENVTHLGVTVHCAPADAALPELSGQASLVVANPPYVPVSGTIADPEVRDWDPGTALWAGADGLEVIRQVESAARRLLRPGGCVIVEHGTTQAVSVQQVFAEHQSWRDIQIYPTIDDNYLLAIREPGHG